VHGDLVSTKPFRTERLAELMELCARWRSINSVGDHSSQKRRLVMRHAKLHLLRQPTAAAIIGEITP
jgi:hypothetical protein